MQCFTVKFSLVVKIKNRRYSFQLKDLCLQDGKQPHETQVTSKQSEQELNTSGWDSFLPHSDLDWGAHCRRVNCETLCQWKPWFKPRKPERWVKIQSHKVWSLKAINPEPPVKNGHMCVLTDQHRSATKTTAKPWIYKFSYLHHRSHHLVNKIQYLLWELRKSFFSQSSSNHILTNKKFVKQQQRAE